MKLLLPLSTLFVVLSFCSGGKLSDILNGKKTGATPLVVNSSNAASPTPVADASPEKPDEETILASLMEVENKWKVAKGTGDKNALDKIFADEFINFDGTGKKYTKSQWIKALSGGDPTRKSFAITDASIVSSTDTTATLSFVIAYSYKNGSVNRQRDTDVFVLRDRRWQVVSSQSTDIKK